ncbi:MAG: DNA gyrase inhibitor YacG [Gammaproteobacteria bacterium]|nr:DNA gyrase inhibitor YacG [Gammaproteobacteria bacterium]
MNSTPHEPVVKCPTCSRRIEWSEAFPQRPFCSERCRLIDLGAWFSEERNIPGTEPQEVDRRAEDRMTRGLAQPRVRPLTVPGSASARGRSVRAPHPRSHRSS